MLFTNKNKYKIRFKYLGVFVFVFMVLIPIGTITHELGHLVVAKQLSYQTELHYSSISWESDFKKSVIKRYLKNQNEIENNLPFNGKELYNKDVQIINKHDVRILIGGVFQTILTGSIFFMLFIFSKKNKNNFSLLQWVYLFVSLFWLRKIFNLFFGFYVGLSKGNNVFFYGDEARIAVLLNIHKGSILIPLAIISFAILAYLIKMMPLKYKSTFIIGGLIGCPLGYFLWMNIFGPLILPN